MPNHGVAVTIPEPWATTLQSAREAVGDTMASAIPPHVTLLPPTAIHPPQMPSFLEHLSAVTDDYDEELGEGDIDLRSFELVETVSVRGLVGALNGLLARTDFDRRFLMLVADGKREVYVAVPSAGALSLLHQRVLDHDSEEWLIDYCAF